MNLKTLKWKKRSHLCIVETKFRYFIYTPCSLKYLKHLMDNASNTLLVHMYEKWLILSLNLIKISSVHMSIWIMCCLGSINLVDLTSGLHKRSHSRTKRSIPRQRRSDQAATVKKVERVKLERKTVRRVNPDGGNTDENNQTSEQRIEQAGNVSILMNKVWKHYITLTNISYRFYWFPSWFTEMLLNVVSSLELHKERWNVIFFLKNWYQMMFFP